MYFFPRIFGVAVSDLIKFQEASVCLWKQVNPCNINIGFCSSPTHARLKPDNCDNYSKISF